MVERFRIATWNLERPCQKGWEKNQRRLNQIHAIDADVWVLTETNKAIELQGYEFVASSACPWERYEAGENLVTIWSRWKVLQPIETFDSLWTICAEVDSPFGAMLIYGTVIPYANYEGNSGTAKRWEEQRRSIQQHHEDWLRLQQKYPHHLICVAGDFNQSRDQSGWYEDKQSVDMLTAALQDLSLVCVTQDNFQKKGLSRSTVDHICLPASLESHVVEVGFWEGKTLENAKMSDHNGIFVDLERE